MNLPGEVKVILDEEFDSIIWRIEIDSEHQLIAVETRDAGNHQAALSVFNYADGKCFFKELSIENNWQLHLDRVYKDLVLLYAYVSDASPEHKGITGLDINTGKLRFQNFAFALSDVSSEGLIVYNPLLQSRKPLMLDFAFGIPVPGFSDDYKPVDRDISFPEILKPNINKRGYLPENILGPIHFAEVGETGIFSYHTQENQAFSQHLVFVRDNRIIKEQILAAGIQKLNPEAFFISGRFVYAVNGDNRKIAVFLI